jgi:hypothetical protein
MPSCDVAAPTRVRPTRAATASPRTTILHYQLSPLLHVRPAYFCFSAVENIRVIVSPITWRSSGAESLRGALLTAGGTRARTTVGPRPFGWRRSGASEPMPMLSLVNARAGCAGLRIPFKPKAPVEGANLRAGDPAPKATTATLARIPSSPVQARRRRGGQLFRWRNDHGAAELTWRHTRRRMCANQSRRGADTSLLPMSLLSTSPERVRRVRAAGATRITSSTRSKRVWP